MGDEAMGGGDDNRSRMMDEDGKNCTAVAEACWRSDVAAPLRSVPSVLPCMAVEIGDVEALNLRTVEAKQKAKWPSQEQATEQRRGPTRYKVDLDSLD